VIGRIDHLEVYSRDIDRTIDFYVNTLGFTLGRRTESVRDDGSNLGLACVRLGDMMVEIIKADPEALDQPVDQTKMGMRMFALRVDDMAKTVEYLKDKGVEFFQAPRETGVFDGLRAEILDPDGIRIELREWQRGDSCYNDDWQPSRPNVTKLN